ncbi:MAG: Na+/H+ antiporter NhaA [Nitrococcus sp.]|nr:Na+/H+ antiporter NhaA [Nitrococcus sp.]
MRGPDGADVTLVEYGDYQCVYCRRAHAVIGPLLDGRLSGRVRYVFRHFPNTRLHPDAQRAAEAAEAAADQDRFWDMHDYLFDHQDALDRDSLVAGAAELGLDTERFAHELDERTHEPRVREDFDHAFESGAHATPSFFINGRRYDGAWDEESVLEAMRQPLGWKVRALAQDFAGLSVSAGALMLGAAVIALIWANSPWQGSYFALWHTEFALRLGPWALPLTLHEWVNDGLIVIFFFVVSLEIKREVTAGELRKPRRAILPLAAAAGGMAVPALIYWLFNAGGPHAAGWGVPIATDTAFALGLLAAFGSRVPLALRVFVATLAIADDVGAILVLALVYTDHVGLPGLALAAVFTAAAYGLNRARVYWALPYALIGLGLWAAVLHSGLHPTLAGVLLGFTVPTRSRPRPAQLHGQSMALFHSLETPPSGERQQGQYQAAVRGLESMVERLLSPAQRLERNLQPWSSYLVLPLFALANAGIVLTADTLQLLQPLSLGILAGLVIGKPLGITLGAWLAARSGLADSPQEFNWRQVAGAGALCGIGFTMSIFIAESAFSDPTVLAQAKVSIMLASVLATLFGWRLLRGAGARSDQRTLADRHPTATGT